MRSVFFFFRDRLTADDCVGTGYLPISTISGQGDDGKEVIKVFGLLRASGRSNKRYEIF